MAFTSLKIENFRGIKSLEMSDLGQVNVLVGKNNSGKTSVLEAICSGNGGHSQDFFRDITKPTLHDMPLLFRNLDVQNHIRIQIKHQDNSVNVFEIEPHFVAKNGTRNTAPNDFRIQQMLSLTSKPDIERYDYLWGENVDSYLPPIYPLTWLHPKNLTDQLDQLLSQIIEQKREQNIITALAEVDAAISDIRLGAQGAIYCDIGLPRLVPIGIMGDGIRRILSIIVNVLSAENGIALIDEISNDLHYSTLQILWKAVLKAAKEFNVQIFATTHSYECLAALVQVQEANLFGEDLVRVFRLERDGEGHRAVKIKGEGLSVMIEDNWEIR